MKKVIAVLLALISLVCVIAFVTNRPKYTVGEIFEHDVDTMDGISMVVLQDTVKPTGLTIKITNSSDEKIDGDPYYTVQILDGGEWRTLVPDKKYAQLLMGQVYLPNKAIEENLKWTKLYGRLQTGQYRIVKEVWDSEEKAETKFWIAAEFEIS